MRHRRTKETPKASNKPLSEAKLYEEYSIETLRAAGFRITMPRVQVIRALADTKKALSAYAIHEKIVDGGGKIDVVSVYRILATLEEVGLIYHIGVVDGYFPCRMKETGNKLSEVVVFEASNDVMELKLPQGIIDVINEQASEVGFRPTMIKVEITGEKGR